MTVPYFVVAASVPPGNRVCHFHGTGSDSASALLSDIQRFRYGSFDVAIPGWPEPGPDDSLQLDWPDRKLLRLYQDGTLVFRARADGEFLGWGVRPDAFHEFPKLNPLTVVEVNTSFVYLLQAILGHLKHQPEIVHFSLVFKDVSFPGGRLFMTKYFPDGHVDWSTVTRWEIQTTEESLELPATTVLETPARAAYQVVRGVTSMFDLPEEVIPFVTEEDGERVIDLDSIANL